MNALGYLSLMRDKGISFRVVQHGLKFSNLSSARGWEPLLEHYSEINSTDVNESVRGLYLSQLFFGQRTVYFSQISEDEHGDLSANIVNVCDVIKEIFNSSTHTNLSLYRNSYPLPISHDELQSVPLTNPCPVFLDETDEMLRIIFTYPRAYKERVIIDISEINLSDDGESQFSGFDEIIGVKSGRAQSFDCVQLDKNTGVIQFQIDHSRNILKDEMDSAARRYRHMLMDGYRDMNNISIPMESINIHSKIDELYDSDDGRIHNLEHATATGSVKTEKMRKREDDLRDEQFHLAGLDAIDGDTNNFCITKQWDGECGSCLKLTIDGGVSLAARSNPKVDCATLEGCITENDFNLLISKVL
ncbi:hypothetical protein Dpoa2040_003567 [Dickeya sp. CFBP 2040]|uniref:hypothetical protein n=1 Tax=Dickeya sp. CFBP 2040 TaxID=2718531 RepID=UPI001447E05A|nr:hypothetical protein [Dickeya sp. CFBP 2040]NKI76225.1 hypothetical protein [Dickeya sp. CFBP 2040]